MIFLCDAESGRASTGRVFCFGYDDNGTPDDDSDDGYFYYIRWYRLTSGRNSSYGEIWLYDQDFERVQSWSVPSLHCVEHGYADGLRANPEGLLHGVIVRVPVSLMEKAGTYRFVLHFYDDYADSYKNHQVKAALEINIQKRMRIFHIEDDWMVTPDGKKLDPYARSKEVKNAFRKADWIVHTAGAKCGKATCVLPSVCTAVPYKETLPTEQERREYSRTYFFYYEQRNSPSNPGQPYRYVHVIGAAYMTGKGDTYYGMSLESDRYSYIFVRLLIDTGTTGKNLEYLIKQTTIHELGHQFGLNDHPADKPPPNTRNGKVCVMWDSAPTILIDLEFCDECLKRIRSYNW